jgi:hypothetical protein
VKYKILFLLFVVGYLLLAIFSYGFVDTNFPLNFPKNLATLFFRQRPIVTAIFIVLVCSLIVLYIIFLRQIKNKRFSNRQTWCLISLIVAVLIFSWPGFSNDIFNYIATAKVTYLYKENPYLTMPIEFVGEPMLKFMHAANKTALYAPFWIILTGIPHFLGLGNLLLTVFTFKLFIAGFYLACCWLIWKITKKNLYCLAFFALNPLVIFESLVTAHNDIVMMAFVLLAIYLFLQKRKIFSWIALLASVGIKYATIVLTPLFIFLPHFKKEKLIALAAWLMFLVFLLSPLREEIYPWYFIWVVVLAALVPQHKLLRFLVFAFTFSLLMRYTPYLYFRTYKGLTQLLKTLITFIPPGLTLIYFRLNRRS